MSILFLSIGSIKNKCLMGNYIQDDIKNSEIRKEIELKAKEIFNKNLNDTGITKTNLTFKNIPGEKKIEIFYTITSGGFFYIIFVEILEIYSENFKDDSIYELFELLEQQNIKKLVNENNELTSVGLQNLKIFIEKYENSYYNSQNNIDDKKNISLIEEINNQINDAKNEMKENVKNMIHNVNDINEIENKSEAIKDASFKFESSSKSLENKFMKSVCRNRILLVVCLLILISIIIFVILK